MALNLATEVRVIVKDGKKTIVDCVITSRELTKKDQREITRRVTAAQKDIESDPVKSLDEIELVAKSRFDIQISGDDMEALRDFGEDFGYVTLLNEISDLVGKKQGKQSGK